MNLMPPDDQPEVIIKPESSFFLSPKFMVELVQ